MNLSTLLKSYIEIKNESHLILAFGSSIIEQYVRNNGYANWIDHVSNSIRFNYSKNIVFLNQGISGDNVIDLGKRLNRDVLSYKPKICIIAIGGNCARDNISVVTWMTEIRSITEQLLLKDIVPVFCTYFQLDFENLPSEYLVYLQYRDEILKYVEENNIIVVDNFYYFSELVKAGFILSKYLRNPNHVNEYGHAILAHIFLKSLNICQPEIPEWINNKLIEEFKCIEKILTTSST